MCGSGAASGWTDATPQLVVPRSIPMMYGKAGLLDFDFGRREDFCVLTGADLRQVDLLCAPAFVAKDALRSFPVGGHVADELYGVRIVLSRCCVRVPSTPSMTG